MVAMGFGFLFFFQNKSGSGSAGRAVRRVSTNPANQGAYPSIRQALRESKPGDKIVLLDPVHEEALVVDGGRPDSGPTEVTIEAADGVKVRWQPPPSQSPAEPILRLISAPGFRLKGNGILLDGKNRVKSLVTISGTCPGLKVDGLELRGFSRTAVTLVSCVGNAQSWVRLHGLKSTTAEGEAPEAGILFEVDEAAQPRRKNDFVFVEQCHSEGLPFGVTDAVQRNPNVAGENVRVIP